MLRRVFSVRHEFGSQLVQYRATWTQFLQLWTAADSTHKPATPELKLDISGKFPHFARRRAVSVSQNRLYVTQSDGVLQSVTAPANQAVPSPVVTLTADSDPTITIDAPSLSLSLDPSAIADLFVICPYTVG